MEKATKSLKKRTKKNKIRYWLRVIHRDLGYLMVGITMIYAISGILLNHLGKTDPAFKTEERTLQINTALSHNQLKTYWETTENLPKLKRILKIDEDHFRLMLEGGIGVYSKVTGVIDYETHRKRAFVYWINKLHYNKVKNWSFMADFFAGSLIFLALSGLFMIRGKKGIVGRGKWFLFLGVLIPLIYIMLS